MARNKITGRRGRWSNWSTQSVRHDSTSYFWLYSIVANPVQDIMALEIISMHVACTKCGKLRAPMQRNRNHMPYTHRNRHVLNKFKWKRCKRQQQQQQQKNIDFYAIQYQPLMPTGHEREKNPTLKTAYEQINPSLHFLNSLQRAKKKTAPGKWESLTHTSVQFFLCERNVLISSSQNK